MSTSAVNLAAPPAHTVLVSLELRVSGGPPELCVEARDVSRPAHPENVDDAPFSFGFTGRHDGGVLPPVRDGFYAHVLDACSAMKVEASRRLDTQSGDTAGDATGSASHGHDDDMAEINE